MHQKDESQTHARRFLRGAVTLAPVARLELLKAEVWEVGFRHSADGDSVFTLWPRCQVWATVEGFDDWVVFGEVVPTDGGLVVRELRVYPRPPSDEDLRAIPTVYLPQLLRELPTKRGRSLTDAEEASLPAGLLEYYRVIDDEPPVASVPARVLRAFSADGLIELARPEIDRMREFWHQHAEEARAQGAQARAVTLPLEVAEAIAAMRGAKRRTGRRGHSVEYYLSWAVEYAELVQSSEREERRKPVRFLAQRHGEKDQFVHDTIHRARRLGLLDGRALSAKALALLESMQDAQINDDGTEAISTRQRKSSE